jgi:hypothetical protein
LPLTEFGERHIGVSIFDLHVVGACRCCAGGGNVGDRLAVP